MLEDLDFSAIREENARQLIRRLLNLIEKLSADDSARARQMGINGRKYLEENFSRAAIFEKLENLLKETLRL